MKIFCLAALVSTSTAVNNITTTSTAPAYTTNDNKNCPGRGTGIAALNDHIASGTTVADARAACDANAACTGFQFHTSWGSGTTPSYFTDADVSTCGTNAGWTAYFKPTAATPRLPTDPDIVRTGDAPKCEIVNGHTVVAYSDAFHPSFHCSHTNGQCSCTVHPTHNKGGCKEIVHTNGVAVQHTGDCTDTGKDPPPFQENIGGCCSGRNELGTLGLGYGGADTRSQRIEECKAMCASKADCVSFELHPGGPNRPESEIPGCWFSLTCKANEYPGGGCGHDLYIKQ